MSSAWYNYHRIPGTPEFNRLNSLGSLDAAFAGHRPLHRFPPLTYDSRTSLEKLTEQYKKGSGYR
ncbi:MAG: hypothetical protein GTN36_00060 [Candidatus Aenigmarchaeota archaeon]|nr:hypothetical protein [Candidatus Aenigmarchaeota archaeon]